MVTGLGHHAHQTSPFVIFFLWGQLKQAIWTKPIDQQPKNLVELRAAIVSACEELDPVMIRRAFTGMVSRARKCVEANGNSFLID